MTIGLSAVVHVRAVLLFTISALGCGGSSGPALDTLRPPPSCLQPDPPGTHGGDASFTLAVGQTVEVPLRMTLAGQSARGVMDAKRLSDRIRFTALRPGASEVFLVQDGGAPGCISFTFRVRP